ncbi:DUF5785 family protein [Natronorarus salvus]|uniref:DUF5785 family protein n=1 Tax=Natronorarus salvus TaxID=3117733 RepID=UPI002F269593
MDWPHDPDGEEGSEGMRKYDMAVFAKKVDEDDDFPLTFSEFEARVGDHPIRINSEKVVPAREILAHVDVEEVEDILEFHRAIGRAMREGGFWDYHPVGANPEVKRA